MTNTEDTDVVVVGAGIAGLVAAAEALNKGVSVTVLEKGPRAGGSMYLSGGAIWTYDSLERVRSKMSGGNSDLQRLVVESLDEDLRWLRDDVGADLRDIEYDVPGSGMQFDPPSFTEYMVDYIESRGGNVRLRTPMTDLVTDDSGKVVGVEADTESGNVELRSDRVVLATGGFQGNEELVERYIVDDAENLWLRANPWSTGDGLLAAKDVGAKTTKGMSGFYGHNLAAPPAEFSANEFLEVSQYYGPAAIAVDEDGERFTDEAESDLEETLAQDTAKLADGRAVLILDRDVYDTYWTVQQTSDMIARARDFGGNVIEAESFSKLERELVEWGVNGTQAVRTIQEFNEAIARGDVHTLDPPRSGFRNPIDAPPFYAVEVQAGITFTTGGLAVNEDTQVLMRAGSSSSISQQHESADATFTRPIEGLFAAGVDIGNVNHRYYLGGMALGLVTGRIAGRNASENAE